jgi:hypothetical protein
MKLVKKFDSYLKNGYAGAHSKNFKFKFENTECKRGYRVTWCPDAHTQELVSGGKRRRKSVQYFLFDQKPILDICLAK